MGPLKVIVFSVGLPLLLFFLQGFVPLRTSDVCCLGIQAEQEDSLISPAVGGAVVPAGLLLGGPSLGCWQSVISAEVPTTSFLQGSGQRCPGGVARPPARAQAQGAQLEALGSLGIRHR